MTTADLIQQALQALTPDTGFHSPNQQQTSEAHARGVIATASALNRIADALETLAANTTPTATIQPAIHHSA